MCSEPSGLPCYKYNPWYGNLWPTTSPCIGTCDPADSRKSLVWLGSGRLHLTLSYTDPLAFTLSCRKPCPRSDSKPNFIMVHEGGRWNPQFALWKLNQRENQHDNVWRHHSLQFRWNHWDRSSTSAISFWWHETWSPKPFVTDSWEIVNSWEKYRSSDVNVFDNTCIISTLFLAFWIRQ